MVFSLSVIYLPHELDLLKIPDFPKGASTPTSGNLFFCFRGGSATPRVPKAGCPGWQRPSEAGEGGGSGE